uniref:Uncharacterized protein n=1 Tax=Bactrocera dorsalis TaxID=27457 RepID=A0A034VDW3_BACDO
MAVWPCDRPRFATLKLRESNGKQNNNNNNFFNERQLKVINNRRPRAAHNNNHSNNCNTNNNNNKNNCDQAGDNADAGSYTRILVWRTYVRPKISYNKKDTG